MMKYVTKIRAKISIYASKKTSNILDGSYKSIYQGNGFDFENLREYIPGDNIKDIDWKASSRSRNLLVKRYIAEKKHNIMLVFDTGKKMSAHTKCRQSKKDVALNAGGTIGYLSGRNGDNIGALYNRNGFIQYYELRTGLFNVERILSDYDKEDCSNYNGDLEKSLDFLIKNIRRKMIVFIISDAAGIRNVSEDTLKKLTCQHDVLFIQVTDADFTDGKSYDIESDTYIPAFITDNKKLKKIEQETKEKLYEELEDRIIRYKIVSTQIDSEEDIIDKLIEMLGRYKYANKR